MKDVETGIPLPKASRRQSVPERPSVQPLSAGAFFAEHRAAIDARKVHLSRVGIGPAHVEPTPRVEGLIELPTQTKALAMTSPEPTADLPPAMGDADGAEHPTLYKPRRLPADAVNHEA